MQNGKLTPLQRPISGLLRALCALAATGGLLVCAGPAQARPWLTMHRAKAAMLAYARHNLSNMQDPAVVDCSRRSRVIVDCDIDGFAGPGDPAGPQLDLPGWTASTDNESHTPVEARLTRDNVRVHEH
jgi:hypothetical protein